mgnify:CR=1 FL=1
MFKENGRAKLVWLAGRDMLIEAKGYPSDMAKALILGLRKVVEANVPPEKQREAMRLLADQLLKLTDVTTTNIDLAALLKGRAEG